MFVQAVVFTFELLMCFNFELFCVPPKRACQDTVQCAVFVQLGLHRWNAIFRYFVRLAGQ